ncbi:putative DNA binding CopG/RHH family protein [Pantoea alhagi]|nr:putative DNA binding CopG/RHH family protein [Pantoea alhagi]
MSKNAKQATESKSITTTDEAWETGELGRSEAHVKVSDITAEFEFDINEALELQPISIRLNKSLIEDLKMIAELNGLGYQPLIRQILNRFVDCEKKKLLQEVHSEEMKKLSARKKTKKIA